MTGGGYTMILDSKVSVHPFKSVTVNLIVFFPKVEYFTFGGIDIDEVSGLAFNPKFH
jgi:hypothetical protein